TDGLNVLNLFAQLFFGAQTFGWGDQQFFDQFVHERADVLAVFVAEVIHSGKFLMKEGGAAFFQAAAQGVEHAGKFDAGLPGDELGHVLFHQDFGLGNFILSCTAILLNDFAEVFHAVEVAVIEFADGRIDVAGHPQVHQEEGAVAARGHGALDQRFGKESFLHADGGNDDVGQLQCGVPVAPIEHFPFVLLGKLLGFITGAIGEVKPADVAVAKLGNDLFADGAGAKYERGAIVELAKNALGELHARGGDAHGARAKLGFRAYALANFEGGLKQAVQDGAGDVRGVGAQIGFANLAENLGFAQEHGFQAGRNAEQMADGVVIVVVIESGTQQLGREGVKVTEKAGKRGGRGAFRRGVDAVDLAAVARGKDQRFFQDALSTQFLGGALGLFGGERHLFPHLHRRRTEVQADEDNLHAVFRALLEIPVVLGKEEIHHPEVHYHQNEVEDAQFRGPSAAPGRRPCQAKIDDVQQKHEQREDVFRVKIGVVFRDVAIHGDKSERRADEDGD